MKLPNEFQCMGNTIKIKYYKRLPNMGEYHPESGLIKIWKPKGISDDQIMTTIMHETVHCFMYNMGLEDLFKDEQFTDILGNLILQWNKTKK